MPEEARWELLFKRDALEVTEVREVAAPDLEEDQVELAMERVGLTMNNVTYARYGDVPPMNFWHAFPAPDPALARLPVWGFVRVSRSRHPGYSVGDRFYGYLPSSSHHLVRPEPASRGFVDTTPDRQFPHPWYQTFQPAGDADGRDDRRTLLRPIFPASFHVAGYLAAKAAGDGLTVLLTSASSKVSIGIAHCLRSLPNVRTVGLTSARNRGLVSGLGLYDQVGEYRELSAITVDGPLGLVDLAGDNELVTTIHGTFQGQLAHITMLGWTHGVQLPPPVLADPPAELFFTPAVEHMTIEAEGEDAFFARYHAAEDEFLDFTESWLTVVAGRGPEALATVIQSLDDGTHPADCSTIITP
jgi:hypothetical protein